jgi:dipeptidyl aminopeptidase/acylaminoacyl peptidase
MKRIALFSICALTSVAQTFQIEDYAKVARVADPHISPDGRNVVVVVSHPNYVDDHFDSELVRVSLPSGAIRELTHQRKTARHPRWSPAGDRLAFLADTAGEGQIFILDFDGGEASQVTHAPTGVQGFSWSPDGKTIAYISRDEAPKREKYDDSFEVEANDYLMQAGTQPSHLWTVPSAGGAAKRLTSGHWSVSGVNLSWSAAGDRIVFISQPSSGTRDSDKRSMESVGVGGGAPVPVAGIENRRCAQPSFSPDGRWLGMACPVDGRVKNQTELLLLPAAGGEFKRLSVAIDRNFSRGLWTADSKGLIATAPDAVGTGLWSIALAGTSKRWQLGTVSTSAQDVDMSRDGQIALVGTEAHHPAELYLVKNPQSEPVRLTNFQAEIAGLKLGRVESIFWKSDDGLPLNGVLTFPPDFDPARKYPLLLNIHGGPWGSSRETFSERSQMFASRGFVIFEPNYRGSDNQGNALFSAVYRDHGAGPGRDIMAGVAEVKKRPYIDASRIGVSGWSYGGYMTTWLIGHYQGWKAAMAGAAVIDLEDDYNLNDLRLFTRAFSDTLTTAKDHELMKEQSPISAVDQMKTPLLMISDTGDMRVPVTQSYKLYHALKERGQDVKMVLYPVPGHFPADPYRIRDIDRRWADWFSERLK